MTQDYIITISLTLYYMYYHITATVVLWIRGPQCWNSGTVLVGDCRNHCI